MARTFECVAVKQRSTAHNENWVKRFKSYLSSQKFQPEGDGVYTSEVGTVTLRDKGILYVATFEPSVPETNIRVEQTRAFIEMITREIEDPTIQGVNIDVGQVLKEVGIVTAVVVGFLGVMAAARGLDQAAQAKLEYTEVKTPQPVAPIDHYRAASGFPQTGTIPIESVTTEMKFVPNILIDVETSAVAAGKELPLPTDIDWQQFKRLDPILYQDLSLEEIKASLIYHKCTETSAQVLKDYEEQLFKQLQRLYAEGITNSIADAAQAVRDAGSAIVDKPREAVQSITSKISEKITAGWQNTHETTERYRELGKSLADAGRGTEATIVKAAATVEHGKGIAKDAVGNAAKTLGNVTDATLGKAGDVAGEAAIHLDKASKVTKSVAQEASKKADSIAGAVNDAVNAVAGEGSNIAFTGTDVGIAAVAIGSSAIISLLNNSKFAVPTVDTEHGQRLSIRSLTNVSQSDIDNFFDNLPATVAGGPATRVAEQHNVAYTTSTRNKLARVYFHLEVDADNILETQVWLQSGTGTARKERNLPDSAAGMGYVRTMGFTALKEMKDKFATPIVSYASKPEAEISSDPDAPEGGSLPAMIKSVVDEVAKRADIKNMPVIKQVSEAVRK